MDHPTTVKLTPEGARALSAVRSIAGDEAPYIVMAGYLAAVGATTDEVRAFCQARAIGPVPTA